MKLFTHALRSGDLQGDDKEFAYYNRGKAYLGEHEYKLAIADLKAALKLKPDDDDAQSALQDAQSQMASASPSAGSSSGRAYAAAEPPSGTGWGYLGDLSDRYFWYEIAGKDPHLAVIHYSWSSPQQVLNYWIRNKSRAIAAGEYKLDPATGKVVEAEAVPGGTIWGHRLCLAVRGDRVLLHERQAEPRDRNPRARRLLSRKIANLCGRRLAGFQHRHPGRSLASRSAERRLLQGQEIAPPPAIRPSANKPQAAPWNMGLTGAPPRPAMAPAAGRRYHSAALAGRLGGSSGLSDPVEPLIADLVAWVAKEERPYLEVMEAWRTACPRLPVWEEANARGLVTRGRSADGIATVRVTQAGRDFLARPPRSRSAR